MKRLMLIILGCWALVACGGSKSEPVLTEPDLVQVQATEAPTIVVATALPPTQVPTIESQPTETVVAIEPTAAVEAYDFYGEYRVPDVTTILATGRPQFINSYTDW